MTIERPRRWYFIPALLAVTLVTMGFGGIWVGPKEKKVKLGKTTRDKLAEDFLAAARSGRAKTTAPMDFGFSTRLWCDGPAVDAHI